MDTVRGVKRSAAALALGLGLTIAASPAVAGADDTDTPSTDARSPQSTARRGGAAEARGRRRRHRRSARQAELRHHGTAPVGGRGRHATRPTATLTHRFRPQPQRRRTRSRPPRCYRPRPPGRQGALVRAVTAPSPFLGDPCRGVGDPRGHSRRRCTSDRHRPAPAATMPSAVMTATPLNSSGQNTVGRGRRRGSILRRAHRSPGLGQPGGRQTAQPPVHERRDPTALGTAAVKPAAAAGNTVVYSVVNDWGTGHTANMAVTAGSSNLTGWTVEFDTRRRSPTSGTARSPATPERTT